MLTLFFSNTNIDNCNIIIELEISEESGEITQSTNCMSHNHEEPDLRGEKSSTGEVIVVLNKGGRSRRIPGAYWPISLHKLGSLEFDERLYLRR